MNRVLALLYVENDVYKQQFNTIFLLGHTATFQALLTLLYSNITNSLLGYYSSIRGQIQAVSKDIQNSIAFDFISIVSEKSSFRLRFFEARNLPP